jgi:membrane-associated protease RseP (regulator of RpoE activity)
LRYRAASGEWFTNGPWTLAPSYRNHLLEGAAGSPPLTVTSRIVYSYAEPDMPDPPIVWSGQTRVTYKGEELPMRTDTLTGVTPGSLLLSRHCDSVPRLGAATESAREYQYNGQTYTHGVRVLEVQTGQLADRLGLRPGDVIYKINDQVIENRDALVRTMVRLASEPMTIHFIRGPSNLNVTVPATGR